VFDTADDCLTRKLGTPGKDHVGSELMSSSRKPYETPPDGVKLVVVAGEVAHEASHGLDAALAFGFLAGEVGASGRVNSSAGDRDDVQWRLSWRLPPRWRQWRPLFVGHQRSQDWGSIPPTSVVPRRLPRNLG
jgi:hypothetical protein